MQLCSGPYRKDYGRIQVQLCSSELLMAWLWSISSCRWCMCAWFLILTCWIQHHAGLMLCPDCSSHSIDVLIPHLKKRQIYCIVLVTSGIKFSLRRLWHTLKVNPTYVAVQKYFTDAQGEIGSRYGGNSKLHETPKLCYSRTSRYLRVDGSKASWLTWHASSLILTTMIQSFGSEPKMRAFKGNLRGCVRHQQWKIISGVRTPHISLEMHCVRLWIKFQ